ncbi:MAG: SEC-C metal-binding domain-containing protein [Chloroflexi bacterium]|nr:SEC-C metal-binding domain-containing protein [Chloroflexota bacterium]
MNISPQRRRRTLREHQLRQNGYTLEQIAEKVNVAVSTVHADLRLLETNWADFAGSTRNDLLLQQINRVNRRIGRLINAGVVGLELCTTADQAFRARSLYSQELNAACRELRLLLRELPAEAPHSGDIIELELADYPDHELADPEQPRKNLKKPESERAAIPHKTRETEPAPPPEKNSAENPKTPLPKNTGRNKPCPCGSGQKRKHCHPQHSRSPSPGEAGAVLDTGVSRSSLPPARPGDRAGLPRLDSPPDIEAEVLRLTREFDAADRNNDQLTQIRVLERLATLPGK